MIAHGSAVSPRSVADSRLSVAVIPRATGQPQDTQRMNRPPISQPLMLAAINALLDAEEAKQPIAARVSAVAAALGLGPLPADPTVADLAAQLEQLANRLGRHVESAGPAADPADRAAVDQARAVLAQLPPAP